MPPYPKPVTSRTIPSSTPKHDWTERDAYLALALVPGLGARRLAALLSVFETPAQVLSAPLEALVAVERVPRSVAIGVHRASREGVPGLLAHAASLGQRVLTPDEDGFPPALRSIPDPPVALWTRGALELLRSPAIAVVGSRDHTAYGETVAREVASAAAHAGLVVISGMARGLDAIAHEAALDAGGGTIGVLGNGADIPYPRMNRRLFDRMLERGLLLTEHPPGEEARPSAFPRRNRLISGLARVIVVVEAADGSGTMITVAAALEQGREVLVVPGPVTSHTSRGTNRLIRDGATPLLDVSDLLALFGAEPQVGGGGSVPPPPCTLSPTEARVFGALTFGGRHVDDLAQTVGIPVGELLATLLGLEIGGLAQTLPGGHFRLRERR